MVKCKLIRNKSLVWIKLIYSMQTKSHVGVEFGNYNENKTYKTQTQ